MPRKLISLEEWDLIECPIKDIQCGDVFFTKNTNKPKLISHVALVIDPNKIFHCTPLLQKAVIQSKEEFFSFYEQKLSIEKTLCYVDPRNKELRSKEGMFISIEKILQGNFFGEKEESFVPVCQMLC